MLDIPVSASSVPGATEVSGVDVYNKTFVWHWTDYQDDELMHNCDGNYAQKLMRFPAAWNFKDAIARRGKSKIVVGILDEAFFVHKDLPFTRTDLNLAADRQRPTLAEVRAQNHGTHVCGIIGAIYHNRIGVDGGCPFVTMVAQSVVAGSNAKSQRYRFFGEMLSKTFALMDSNPEIKGR